MKNQSYSNRLFLQALFSLVIAVALVGGAAAQRRFDPKAAGTEGEVKSIAQFTQTLVQFVDQANQIEKKGAASDADLSRLQESGKRIKDGSGNLRGNLQGFISKLKSGNRWNDDFDQEFLDSITNPRVKAFIARLGGARKALTLAEAAINSLNQDVDSTVNDAKNPRAQNLAGEAFFTKASFSAGGSGKVRIKCVLLGVGVAAAEVARLKLTAENLDNLFDSNKCGGAGASTTTE